MAKRTGKSKVTSRRTRTSRTTPRRPRVSRGAGTGSGPRARPGGRALRGPAAELRAERRNAVDKVVAARKALGQARRQPDLTPAQRDLLDTSYQELVDAEDMLALEGLKARVGALEAAATDLRAIARRMERSVARLRAVAKAVDGAAKALGVLADVVAKAASSGLL